jgi:cobalt/nickel transport system permease protein
MKLGLEKYVYLDSYIHRWECRPKLIAFISLIFSFTFIDQVAFLPALIIITTSLYLLAKLPLSFLLSRLRYPGIFILAVIILLPFLVGDTVIFSWGIMEIKQEGCLLMLVVVTRFICILTTTLILLATSPFLSLLKSLKSFGLSPIISDMMLLTYRYLEEFSDRLDRMKKALKLRGFSLHRYNKRQLTIIANLIGSLLVRSYEDSQRVYQAMKLRGYGQTTIHLSSPEKQNINSAHWLASIIVISMSLTLVICQELM